MKICVAQVNPTAGAIHNNLGSILAAIDQATRDGAELIVFPELALSGAPVHDLLFHHDFVETCEEALRKIAAASANIAVVVGSPATDGASVFDAALVFAQGKEIGRQHDVCWEWDLADRRIAVLVGQASVGELSEKTELIVHIAASPWSVGAQEIREQSVAQRAQQFGRPCLFVNLVGGNDGWIFDGNSFYCGADGTVLFRAKGFSETICLVEEKKRELLVSPPMEEIHQALVLGIADFFKKQEVADAVIGLSGGIDSSLTAALAVEALGAEHVHGLLLPSQFTSDETVQGAHALCRTLGISLRTLSIEPLAQTFRAVLADGGVRSEGITDENLQSRIRSVLMMAITNTEGSLLLGTGNKSELAIGYATLYGDLCGALLPLGDLFKTEVYELAAHLNAQEERIPQSIIHRLPTAELRLHQKDTDDLPAYQLLDPLLQLMVVEGVSPLQAAAKTGMSLTTVKRLAGKMMRFEFKRRQGPCVLRVSSKAFGLDVQYPIVNRYRP